MQLLQQLHMYHLIIHSSLDLSCCLLIFIFDLFSKETLLMHAHNI